MELFAVGVGGAVGALLRYCLSQIVIYEGGFPLATLIANLFGCFLLSFILSGTLFNKYPHIRLALTTGVLGAFTTFSTFSYETATLVSDELYGTAFLYISCSMIGGLFLSLIGYKLGSGGVRT
ncbi:fluoride efflux transporter CrcB [Lysinibacillus sp. LZ02]|uniref:fluoride efflux transporter CrcB n=1 Tax=Lysinibacillus sp. LZ02 TaxID=3420668 RepID=UPI003D35EDBF